MSAQSRAGVTVHGAAVLLLLSVGLLLRSCTPALPHSFFASDCCGGKDCGPAPLGSVKWTPGGWRVDTPRVQDTVPFDDTRIRYVPHAELQQFYICEHPVHKLLCLYVSEWGG